VNGQKKIIELFGDYWHGKERTGKNKKGVEKERINCFAKYGYQTLIIWEHELKDINIVINKIVEFNND
jgi:G:T-mismatch repair DNA endonuclease (very short patch repair protein)